MTIIWDNARDAEAGWIIRPRLWHLMDDLAGKQEGWKILILHDRPDSQKIWKCQIIVYFDTFDDIEANNQLKLDARSERYRKKHGLPIQDHEALALVQRKADEGSELHARALAAVAAVTLRGSVE